MKILLITVSLLFPLISFSETDEVITKEELEKSTEVHQKWFKSELKSLEKNFQSKKKIDEQLNVIQEHREKIIKYFKANEASMLTDLRLEFRSFMDLYLESFPTAKFFKVSECPSYRLNLRMAAGGGRETDPANYSWSAQVADDLMSKICPVAK